MVTRFCRDALKEQENVFLKINEFNNLIIKENFEYFSNLLIKS